MTNLEGAPPPPAGNPAVHPRALRGQLYPLPKKSLTKLLGPAVDPTGTPRDLPAGGGAPFGSEKISFQETRNVFFLPYSAQSISKCHKIQCDDVAKDGWVF